MWLDGIGSFRLYKRDVLADLMTSVKGRTYVFQMEVSSHSSMRRWSSSSILMLMIVWHL